MGLGTKSRVWFGFGMDFGRVLVGFGSGLGKFHFSGLGTKKFGFSLRESAFRFLGTRTHH